VKVRTGMVVPVVFAIASLGAGSGLSTVKAAAPGTGATGLPTEYAQTGTVVANAVNELDCNGFAPGQIPAKASMKPLCADPIQKINGYYYKAVDNGHYIGHDEPSIKFESSAPGSANHMTYYMQVPVDPAAAPTSNGSTSIYAMTGPAPWFGMSLCDPNSNPGGPCTPDSDGNDPNTAGQAFMELQFYPPGFQPFNDSVSCDKTHWCVAMTIDSLSCLGCSATSTGVFNANCVEPVNFAFLQTDGVPAGPPSPQLADLETFTPTPKTLLLNQGDTLRVALQDDIATDGSGGLLTTVDDLTTGQTGYMTASANNGFMTTDSQTCNGSPFSFHPTYDTAQQSHMLPWSVLEGGVLAEQEIGHMETCDSLQNPTPVVTHYGNNEFFIDNTTSQTCVGGIPESIGGQSNVGEGPCGSFSLFSSCANPETEGGLPCPGQNVGQGVANSCEGSDATCIPAGTRSVTNLVFNPPNPPTVTNVNYSQAVNECQANQAQNGDLDFDGNSYLSDWPDGTANHPTSMRYFGPFDANGNPYPQVQFETDLAGSENNCEIGSPNPQGCTVPPIGPGGHATFYPYWTLTGLQGLSGFQEPPGSCTWNFGNTIAGITTNDLGKNQEYGSGTATTRGDFISGIQSNPEFAGTCAQSFSPFNFNPCAPVFTVSGSDVDNYSVEGQNLGQTTFPTQLDLLSGNIQPTGNVLEVTMSIAGLNTTLPPGSGENDYRVLWTDAGTTYFALAAVEPGGQVLFSDGQALVVGPETRYQPLHVDTGSFASGQSPGVVEIDVPLANVNASSGDVFTQITGETDVRAGTALTGLLQVEDAGGPQYDELLGQACPGVATPEAPLTLSILGSGLLGAGIVAWGVRRRRLRG